MRELEHTFHAVQRVQARVHRCSERTNSRANSPGHSRLVDYWKCGRVGFLFSRRTITKSEEVKTSVRTCRHHSPPVQTDLLVRPVRARRHGLQNNKNGNNNGNENNNGNDKGDGRARRHEEWTSRGGNNHATTTADGWCGASVELRSQRSRAERLGGLWRGYGHPRSLSGGDSMSMSPLMSVRVSSYPPQRGRRLSPVRSKRQKCHNVQHIRNLHRLYQPSRPHILRM
jgi:hypothetical protein